MMNMDGKLYIRKLVDRISPLITRREIIGIRGPRQAGKTTLMRMIEQSLTENYDTVFINLDIPAMRNELAKNPVDFVKRFKKKKKLFLFLDEVQRLSDGSAIKIIYDEFPDVKIFMSGSSSLEIKSTILPYLVGRAFIFELLTFDFEEFLEAKDAGLAGLFRERKEQVVDFIEGDEESITKAPAFAEDFIKLWEEYATYGGYPEVIKAENHDEKVLILQAIKNLYIEKDIVNFFRIEETGKFEDFVKILAFNTGQLLSISSICSAVGITYAKAKDYLEILKNTYIVTLVRPFHRSMVTEIKKSPKLYFLDLGLRNAVLNNFSDFSSRADQGAIAENFVLRELISTFPDLEIKMWRTTGKAEVDFLLIKSEELLPVEVKLGARLERGFYSFLEKYKPERALVVTGEFFGERRIGDTLVKFVPAFYL
jgi:hypothetical protein